MTGGRATTMEELAAQVLALAKAQDETTRRQEALTKAQEEAARKHNDATEQLVQMMNMLRAKEKQAGKQIEEPIILDLFEKGGSSKQTEKEDPAKGGETAMLKDELEKKEGSLREGKKMEQKYRVMQKMDIYDSFSAWNLALVPDLVIPTDFKIPEFEKYTGNSCPKEHVTHYIRRMTGYHSNEKLMIHVFQESLKGYPAKWYNSLEAGSVRSWGELAWAFIEHFKHLNDEAPDRLKLSEMSMKPDESYRDYAHRWRGVARQVQPPLDDMEMATWFIRTLPNLYGDRMATSTTKSFSELITIGDMIEDQYKKVQKTQSKKKEQTTNVVTGQASVVIITPLETWARGGGKEGRASKPKVQFEKLPVSYSELLPRLYAKDLLKPIQREPSSLLTRLGTIQMRHVNIIRDS